MRHLPSPVHRFPPNLPILPIYPLPCPYALHTDGERLRWLGYAPKRAIRLAGFCFFLMLSFCVAVGLLTSSPEGVDGWITGLGNLIRAQGNWYPDTSKSGVVYNSFFFGKAGDIPVVGDWNGDGTDDAGVFRSSSEKKGYLNYNKRGVTDKTFQFGKSGDSAVVGYGS